MMPHRKKPSPAFARSIYPTLGPRREVATLYDAAALILALDPPQQNKMIWKRAAKKAFQACSSQKRGDIAAARLQVMCALFSEQWL